jgi:MYXO-CTERM domain-containing protein
LDQEQVQLRGGESTKITLTVNVPERALAGQRLVLRTVAETFELTQKAQIETTAFVNIIHDIEPQLETPTVRVYPGGEASYLVEIMNEGNGEDRIDLYVEGGQPGWVVSFEFQDLEVNKIIVSPQLSKTLTVVVETPYDAEAGVFNTKIVLRDSGGNDYEVSLGTEVIQIYEIDLTCSQVHQKGTPGGVLIYPMTLENLGNGHDIIDLEITSIPEGWSYSFKDAAGSVVEQLELNYGDRVDFKLNVWVSDTHMETEETLTMKVQSVFDIAQQDQIQLTAEIRMPDLRIQSVEFNPQNIRENKVVQIRVQLENVGTGGADDVLVEFHDNGKFIADDSISYITTGISGNATAVFTWLPKAGKHNLKFIVDPPTDNKPNGRVLESAEDNNVHLVNKNASGDESLPWPGAPFMLLALMGVAFLLSIRRRGR